MDRLAGIVIVMLDSSGAGNRVMSRQWIYTAISRAKYCCKLIGQLSTALSACKRDALEKRKTFLVEKIQELRPQEEVELEPFLTDSDIDDIFAGVGV